MDQGWITRKELVAIVVNIMLSESECVTEERKSRIIGKTEGFLPNECKRAGCAYFMAENNPK